MPHESVSLRQAATALNTMGDLTFEGHFCSECGQLPFYSNIPICHTLCVCVAETLPGKVISLRIFQSDPGHLSRLTELPKPWIGYFIMQWPMFGLL